MAWIVIRSGIEPVAIERLAERVGFRRCKQSSILIGILPFLPGIDDLPALGNATSLHDLLEKDLRERHSPKNVCWLASIMSDQLECILERSVFSFCRLAENLKFTRFKDSMQTVARMCEIDDIW